MPFRPSLRIGLVASSLTSFVLLAVALDGCSSASTSSTADGGAPGNGAKTERAEPVDSSSQSTADSAVDAGPDAAPDSSAPPSGKGETCVGFGMGEPCGTSGFGAYGYVCVNGSPPGIADCSLARSSGTFGDTYCCGENKCVAQPDQDSKCTEPGTPHRYQCPPTGTGGSVSPPSSCVVNGDGGTALDTFYCCP